MVYTNIDKYKKHLLFYINLLTNKGFFLYRSLVSFSDGCGGQNKNRTIVGLLAEFHRTGVYEVLNHRFLIRGHTFLENDIDFSQIEKRKKSASVYVPQDWLKVVEETNRVKPFIVTEMKQNDFRDWKSYLKERYVPIRTDTNGNRVKLMDAHWLNFGWGEEKDPASGILKMVHHPDEVWLRYGFSTDEPWKKVKILFNPRLKARTPDRLYDSPLKVNAAKLKDLQATASKFIPQPHRQFYMNMTAAPPKEKKKGEEREESSEGED